MKPSAIIPSGSRRRPHTHHMRNTRASPLGRIPHNDLCFDRNFQCVLRVRVGEAHTRDSLILRTLQSNHPSKLIRPDVVLCPLHSRQGFYGVSPQRTQTPSPPKTLHSMWSVSQINRHRRCPPRPCPAQQSKRVPGTPAPMLPSGDETRPSDGRRSRV